MTSDARQGPRSIEDHRFDDWHSSGPDRQLSLERWTCTSGTRQSWTWAIDERNERRWGLNMSWGKRYTARGQFCELFIEAWTQRGRWLWHAHFRDVSTGLIQEVSECAEHRVCI